MSDWQRGAREGLASIIARARRVLYGQGASTSAETVYRAREDIQHAEETARRLGIRLGTPAKHWKMKRKATPSKSIARFLSEIPPTKR